MMRHLPRVPAAAVLLVLGSVVTACGVRTHRFEFPQRVLESRNVNVYPWRVAVVAGREFTPYKITFRYWSSTNFTLPFEGLPDALVNTLRPHFLSVESRQAGPSISGGPYDLIARMFVTKLHFDGANTTVGTDRVDLALTFTFERPDGTKVYETIVAATASSPYSQGCAFCKPDPPEAFPRAFTAAFARFSETLAQSEIWSLRKP